MTSGRILIVDGDYDTLDLLASALREKGHHVSLATDGRSGLQSAVEMSAEVVVVDREVRVLDVRTFLDVLRDNPRTSGAHLFVMGTGDPGHVASIHGRAEPIVKPFNAEEIAARIDEVVRARHEPTREQELRGDLTQVSLFDLLQVFAANRRTGKLVIEGPDASGEIWLAHGELVDATRGYAVGEKAIYRILSVREGSFLFLPDVQASRRRIQASVDQLLMEAARRVDEGARVEEDLPPRGATVSLEGMPEHTGGLVHDLVGHMTEPRTIEELLDLLPAHDLEIMQAIRDLIASKALVVLDVHGKVRFCDADEVTSVRAAMLRLRRPGHEGPIRIGVLASLALCTPRFARAMNAVREFVPSAVAPSAAGEGYFGAIGSLRLGGTELELFALPIEPPYRPLWGTLLSTSTVVLLLGESPPEREVEDLLRAIDIRIVHVPAGFERPAGAVQALREALGTSVGRGYGG